MFRPYTLSLGRVYDRVRIKEGNETLDLFVDADPNRIVAGMDQAQRMLKNINNDSPEEEQKNAALYFAGVLFGAEQANELFEYYHGDSGCVVTVCAKYFTERLGKIITQAQKKAK